MNAQINAETTTLEEAIEPAINSVSKGNKARLSILLVDDDVSFLEVSKQILEEMGSFEVDFATSVNAAFKKLKEKSYDAIVSDYQMPSKNGLDFLKKLRAQKNTIAFILFTGRGREEVASTALNLGADRYINKNGNPEIVYLELADAINKSVERKRVKKLLVESEAKYRLLVEESLQGILIAQGNPPRIVFANLSMGEMLGYTHDAFVSLSPQEVMGLVHPDYRELFFKRYADRLAGVRRETSFAFQAVRRDGTTIWVQVVSNLIMYNGKPAVVGMFLDITERKKTQKEQ